MADHGFERRAAHTGLASPQRIEHLGAVAVIVDAHTNVAIGGLREVFRSGLPNAVFLGSEVLELLDRLIPSLAAESHPPSRALELLLERYERLDPSFYVEVAFRVDVGHARLKVSQSGVEVRLPGGAACGPGPADACEPGPRIEEVGSHRVERVLE